MRGPTRWRPRKRWYSGSFAPGGLDLHVQRSVRVLERILRPVGCSSAAAPRSNFQDALL